MTTDLAQNKYTAKAALPALGSAMAKILPIELTREENFLNGDDDIFDLLSARHRKPAAAPQDQTERLNEMMDLLERARGMLRAAESALQAKNERIRQLEGASDYCAITGLLNERGFKTVLKKEIARTNRGLNEGGLLVCFNLENYAHIAAQTGTLSAKAALRLVAEALKTETRAMDSAARVNENEFVLLLTETTMEKALSRLQNMSVCLNRLSLRDHDNNEVHLSLSLGLKSYGAGARAEQIFQGANDDLQRNRKVGGAGL